MVIPLGWERNKCNYVKQKLFFKRHQISTWAEPPLVSQLVYLAISICLICQTILSMEYVCIGSKFQQNLKCRLPILKTVALRCANIFPSSIILNIFFVYNPEANRDRKLLVSVFDMHFKIKLQDINLGYIYLSLVYLPILQSYFMVVFNILRALPISISLL